MKDKHIWQGLPHSLLICDVYLPNNDNGNNHNHIQSQSRKGPRYIIFFLGGVSYSEIKTCYQFSKKNDVDIFIGSTLIYSPQGYLKCFKKDDDEQKNDQ